MGWAATRATISGDGGTLCAERPAVADEALLADALRLTPWNYFVAWTGQPLAGKPDSLMSQIFSCMTEVATPVRLREVVQRVWREPGRRSGNPAKVRDVVRQHQAATCVGLVLLEQRPTGEFVAVVDIPFGVGSLPRVARGQVVPTEALLGARPDATRRRRL